MLKHSSVVLQQANGGKIPEDQAPKVYLGATCIAEDGIDSQFIESVLVPSGWTGTAFQLRSRNLARGPFCLLQPVNLEIHSVSSVCNDRSKPKLHTGSFDLEKSHGDF